MGVGGTRDGLPQYLGQGQISPRNGQFVQGSAQPGREPRDGMQTAVIGGRRCDTVQDDERTTLSGGG